MSGAMSSGGPFDDRRPWFTVAVTGHADTIPGGTWTGSVLGRTSLTRPGVHEVRSYLDAVLYRRRESHRLSVCCRDTEAGIDHVVREYCAERKISCLPVFAERDLWGDAAGWRRDLEMLARSAALVWFGLREGGPDPVTLAMWLGINYRVVDLNFEREDSAWHAVQP